MTDNTQQVTVYIYRENDRWLATVAGGWWMAYSSTKQGAINSVKRMMEK